MLDQALQKTLEFQSRLGDSVVVTRTGIEYITEYPRNITIVNH